MNPSIGNLTTSFFFGGVCTVLLAMSLDTYLTQRHPIIAGFTTAIGIGLLAIDTVSFPYIGLWIIPLIGVEIALFHYGRKLEFCLKTNQNLK